MKFLKIIPAVLLVCSIAFSSAGEEKKMSTTFSKFNFTRLVNGKFGESTVTPVGENSMKIRIKNTDPHNHVIACSSFEYTAAAQQKLIFKVKGKKTNGHAFLTPFLLIQSGKTLQTLEGPQIPCNSEEFKKYTLGLDKDFKLGDAAYPVRQIKFVVNTDQNAQGSVAEVEITGVRISNAEDAESSAGGYVLYPAPAPKAVAPSGIKVWFELDNDDLSGVRQSRVSAGTVEDPVPSYGYRDVLLEHTEGIFQKAADIDSADVIVYSRASKGENGEIIAQAMKSGKRVIVYGTPADPEVLEELPVKLETLPLKGFASRESIVAGNKIHPALKDVRLAKSELGIYAKATLKSGAQVWGKFSGGNPYITEKGKVLHVNGGIGQVIDTAKTNFHDKTFLRLLGADFPETGAKLDKRDKEVTASNKAAEEKVVAAICREAGVPAAEAKEYRLGRSEKNYGRFGWLIGVPLNSEQIANDLTVSSDGQSYRFHTGGGLDTSPIRGWKRKIVTDGVKMVKSLDKDFGDDNPCSFWTGLGVVEYSTTKVMEPAWKGKRISFVVEKGIDDCDEVYVNGKLIGSTGKETPNYWLVKRSYEIPQELIRWGEPNEIVLKIENLYADAQSNSRPVIAIGSASSASKMVVTRADWAGRLMEIYDAGSEPRHVLVSLLTPFSMYTFPGTKAVLTLENIADSASWLGADGKMKTAALSKSGVFYNRKRDGEWKAPWLILHRKHNTKPLMLVFTTKPDSLYVRVSDGAVEGITIDSSQKDFAVAAGFYNGLKVFADGLPKNTVARANEIVSMALNFPVACREIYRVDRKEKKVKVINAFEYRRFSDDWNTPVRKFVTLPALQGYMQQLGKYVETADPVGDFGIDTHLGPTIGLMDKSAVSFTLPLPDMDKDLIPVGVKQDPLSSDLNRDFAGGVQWSCGGATPVSAWKPAYPQGGIQSKNADIFAWNFGIAKLLQGGLMLTPENRVKMEERVRWRFLELMELYQYKAAVVYRQEPFSGIRYPIVFNSFYPCGADYAPGFGSKIVYGDSNEAVALAVWIAQMLGELYGQSGMLNANWTFLQQIVRYENAVDDYAFLAGSCRETGVGAWIDMLNCEYGESFALARAARTVGDMEKCDEALYRAAVKGVPSIARLYFDPWYEKLHPEYKGHTDCQITGFCGTGAIPMGFPTGSHNFDDANDLFDFSQGFYGSLYLLYRQYGEEKIVEHLKLRAMPTWEKRGTPIARSYMQPYALFWKTDTMLADAERTGKIPYVSDWPGIDSPINFGLILWRLNGKITIEDYLGVSVSSAMYNPQDRTAEIRYKAGAGSRLVLNSEAKPKSVSLNGKALPVSENRFTVPSVNGDNLLKVQY